MFNILVINKKSKYGIVKLLRKSYNDVIFYENNIDHNLNIDTIIFIDYDIYDIEEYKHYNSKKIAWLIESYFIDTKNYNWIKINYDKFNLVLTHYQKLLNFNPEKFKFIILNTTFININDYNLYKKSKLCSIIASKKKYTFGHNLRHDLIKLLDPKKINIYCDGFKKLPKNCDGKIEGCKDYMFQIVIENCKLPNEYTEKILDCFITGVIPIYWGCPNINLFFNDKGILIFNTIDECLNIVNNLSEELYYEKLLYVKQNFDTALNLINAPLIDRKYL